MAGTRLGLVLIRLVTRVVAVLALLTTTSGVLAPGAAEAAPAEVARHPGAYSGEVEGLHLAFTLSADGDRMLAIYFHHRLHGGASLNPDGVLPRTCLGNVCLQGRWIDATLFVGTYESARSPGHPAQIHATWQRPEDLAEGRYAPLGGARVAVTFQVRDGQVRDLVATGLGHRFTFPDTDLVSHHFEVCQAGACLSGHWRWHEIVGHLRWGAGQFAWASEPQR